MTTEERLAFVRSQAVCALAEIEGMKAANSQHENDQPYTAKDFFAISDKYLIGHNAVIAYLGEI